MQAGPAGAGVKDGLGEGSSSYSKVHGARTVQVAHASAYEIPSRLRRRGSVMEEKRVVGMKARSSLGGQSASAYPIFLRGGGFALEPGDAGDTVRASRHERTHAEVQDSPRPCDGRRRELRGEPHHFRGPHGRGGDASLRESAGGEYGQRGALRLPQRDPQGLPWILRGRESAADGQGSSPRAIPATRHRGGLGVRDL